MRLFFRCTVGRLVLGSFQLMVEYVSIATYLVPCMYLCTYRLVHEFLLNIKTCIKAQKCICIYVCIARNMAQWDEIKVALSHKVFHFGSNVQKKVPNHSPEHLFFRWIVLRGVIWHLFFWEIWAKGKFFLRLSYLYHLQSGVHAVLPYVTFGYNIETSTKQIVRVM